MMFERAAICTDLTQSSASVVACAGALAELGVREAVLVHVIDVRSATMGEVPRSEVFERQAELLETAGIRVSIDATIGYPAYEIETVADRHSADLVVIGSHRKGLFPTSFSDSTSSDVVRISSRPVLVVALDVLGGPERSASVCSRVLVSALFLTDLSPRCDLAARYLLALAHKGLERAELLHVVPLGEHAFPDRIQAASRRLEEIADEVSRAGAQAQSSIVHGQPAAIAAERARSGDYTLVVIAPREPRLGAPALDSVANAVLKNSEGPVLVIPPNCAREPRL